MSLCQAARSTACVGLLSDGADSTVCVSLLGRCACSSASSTSDICFAWESTSCNPLGSGWLWLLLDSAVRAMLSGSLEPILASAADRSFACESTSCSTLGHWGESLPFKGLSSGLSSTIVGLAPRTSASIMAAAPFWQPTHQKKGKIYSEGGPV